MMKIPARKSREQILAEVHTAAEVYTKKHFVYTGEDHGDGYVNYRPLGKEEHRWLLRETSVDIFLGIVENAKLDVSRPITVVGPETLGALMVEQLFYASNNELPFLLNTRTFKKIPGGGFTWSAPVASVVNENTQVLWMDDLLNAGSTFTETNEFIRAAGGKVTAIGVIGDRSGLSATDFGVMHVEALERFTLNRYLPHDCPLCKANQPIVRRPGHGHEYEKLHPDYEGGYVDV